MRLSQHFEKHRSLYLFVVFLISIYNLYTRYFSFEGPFIFGDELSYFDMARAFHEHGRVLTSQYMPLYPIFISFFVGVTDKLLRYDLIKLFNFVTFSALVFPLYGTAKRLGFQTKAALLFSLLFALLPWSSIVVLVWAESLFYFLFVLSFYFLVRVWTDPKLNNFILLGLSASFLFLTKQSGIVFILSFLLSYSLVAWRFKLSNFIKYGLGFLAPMVLPVIYVILNKSNGAIGYSNFTGGLIKNMGPVLTNPSLITSFFHQISYLFFSSYGLYFVLVVFALFNWKKLNTIQLGISSFLFFSSILVSLMIALFNTTYEITYGIPSEVELTTGRYLAPYLAFIFLFGFTLTSLLKSRFQFFLFCLPFVLLLGFFSPLKSAFSLGIVNAPDTMFLSQVFNSYFPESRERAHSMAQQYSWILALSFLLFVQVLFYLKSWPTLTLTFLLILTSLNGDQNSQNMNILSDISRAEHNLIRYMIREKIDLSDVYYEKSIWMDPYKYQFWYGEMATSWLQKNKMELTPPDSAKWMITNSANANSQFKSENYNLIQLHTKEHP